MSIRGLVRDLAALRNEIALGIPPGGEECAVSLKPEDSAVLVYALSSAWLSEFAARQPGYRVIMGEVNRVSELLLSADVSQELERFLAETLKENPEAEADGA